MYRWFKRSWLIVLCCCIGWGWGLRDVEASDDPSSHWAKQASFIHNWVQEGNPSSYLKARSEMKKLAKSFSQADFSEMKVSVQGIRALSDSLVSMEGQLNRVMPQQGDTSEASTRLSLAFDALAHPNQPVWLQYESTFRSDIARVKKSLKNGEREAIKASLKGLIEHMKLVMPAIEVSRQPITVQKVRSVEQFFRSQLTKKGTISPSHLSEPLRNWEKMITPLIYGPEKDVVAFGMTNMPPIIPAATVLGTVIALVLGYVGWRNYRLGYRRVRGRL
ncbi:sporulation protein YpjB [Marininema mesophilum]|uniref:Sporulation protein YpjB n=1 Tax=Marininema mesophilum TaxID=1048340 RepID=A0A1H2UVN4_9BACL|nr:sporulation protein YpjB [Marininema mesophilum]SDW59654.1 sporulation protein YpjB [Marininema mesophilum]